MKFRFLTYYLLIALLYFSCNNKTSDTFKNSLIEQHNFVKKETITITKNFHFFWNYYNQNIKLSYNYIWLNTKLERVDKKDFLAKLQTGNFLPLKLIVNKKTYYVLEKVNSWEDKNIPKTIIQMARNELKNVNMEGLTFPMKEFRDITGEVYNKKNTQDKIILFKTWFIGCVACVKEMPELNQIVRDSINSSEILFLSLAIDDNPELIKFNAKHKFNYKIIGNQKAYIHNELKLDQYPTHIIVDKNGEIFKVVNSVKELKYALNSLKSKFN